MATELESVPAGGQNLECVVWSLRWGWQEGLHEGTARHSEKRGGFRTGTEVQLGNKGNACRKWPGAK